MESNQRLSHIDKLGDSWEQNLWLAISTLGMFAYATGNQHRDAILGHIGAAATMQFFAHWRGVQIGTWWRVYQASHLLMAAGVYLEAVQGWFVLSARLRQLWFAPLGMWALLVLTARQGARTRGHAHAVGTDVTERARGESALRLSEERLRKLVENSWDVVVLTDAQGRILYATESVTRVLGYSVSEYVGRRVLDLVHEDDSGRFGHVFRHLLAEEGRSVRVEFRLRHKEGSWRWVEAAATNLLHDSGVAAVVANYRDVTDRREAEEALRLRERQQASLAFLAQRALVAADVNQLLQEAVDLVADTLGVSFGGVLERLPDREAFLLRAGTGWRSGLVGRAEFAVGEATRAGVLKDFQAAGPDSARGPGTSRTESSPWREHGIVSGITSTIEGTGAPYGVLGAYSREEHTFTRDDLHFLRSVADLLAAAIARTRLESERERLVALVEHSHDFIGVATPDAKLVYLNSAGRCLVGLAPEDDLSDRSLFAFASSEDETRLREAAWPVVLERGLWQGEAGFRNVQTGARVDVLMNVFAIRDPQTDAVRFIATVSRDITRRKRTEAALTSSEASLAQAQRRAQLGNWEWTGDAVYWSNEVYRVLGLPPETTPGYRAFLGAVHPEDRRQVRRVLAEATATGGAESSLDLRVVHPDGTEREAHLRGEITRDDDGRPAKLVGTIQDVTAERHMQARLRQAQKMEALGTLAGGIAHDFNNILMAILNFTELIKMSLPEGSQEAFFADQVALAGNRAVGLVSQMLTFSRMRAGNRHPLDLVPLIKETLVLLRAGLPSSVEVRSQMPSKGVWVKASPAEIHQIVMNLCTNAGQAMPEGGTLGLELAVLHRGGSGGAAPNKAPAFACLSVEDSGAGMAPETLERAFDPFFTTKRVGEGTGLGLSVVHGIVTSMGGETSFTSAPGEGTCARVYLPLEPPQKGRPQAVPRRPEAGGRERILLVEDEPQVREGSALLLKRLGYEVIAHSDGRQALEHLQSGALPIDLVLTDLTMPRMGGLELARQVRRRWPHLPVVICTGFGDEIGNDFREAGASDVLTKPLSQTVLDQAIRRQLESRVREDD